MNTYIFKEGRNDYHRVNISDILYIKAEKGRTIIVCSALEIKSPLHFKEVLDIMGESIFQCHRSYAINLDKITKFNTDSIYLSKHIINLGTKYKNELFDKMLINQNSVTSI